MGAAKASISEIDLSTRVPTFPGVFGGIVIQALKGPVDQPVFITSEAQLLAIFTPDERVEVGMDLGFFSALAYLQKSDKLWTVRASKDATFAGASIKRADASTLNQPLPDGQILTDPTAYIFDSNPDDEAVIHIE